MSPRLGVRVVAMADRELREQDGVARFLDRVDHRDDDPERAGIGGLLDVAFVRGRHAHEGDAAGLDDHLDQLLRLTPGERAVLHLDPDEVLTPSQAFFAASRSGPTMVLLKICLPSFSLVMTVLNVCEPALTGGRPPGARPGAAPRVAAPGSAAHRRCRATASPTATIAEVMERRHGRALSHTSWGAVTTVLCSRASTRCLNRTA